MAWPGLALQEPLDLSLHSLSLVQIQVLSILIWNRVGKKTQTSLLAKGLVTMALLPYFPRAPTSPLRPRKTLARISKCSLH